MSRLLGIDVGQSGVRAIVVNDAAQRIHYDDVGITAVLEREPIVRLVHRIGELVGALPTGTCAIGLTGFIDDPEMLSEFDRQLRHAVAAEEVVIVSDVVTAYLGCLGEYPGVTMVWGTGAVALVTDGAGRWARIDGRGYALGDHGSGYWIGHRGLAAALDWFDGRGGSPGLAHLAERLGTPTEIFRQAYEASSTTQFVAEFATSVVDAAAEGDAVANRILDAAAQEIARTIASAVRILPSGAPVRVGLTGGVSQAGNLAERMRSFLSDQIGEVELLIEANAPLHGVLRLAAQPELRRAFPGLVHPQVEEE